MTTLCSKLPLGSRTVDIWLCLKGSIAIIPLSKEVWCFAKRPGFRFTRLTHNFKFFITILYSPVLYISVNASFARIKRMLRFTPKKIVIECLNLKEILRNNLTWWQKSWTAEKSTMQISNKMKFCACLHRCLSNCIGRSGISSSIRLRVYFCSGRLIFNISYAISKKKKLTTLCFAVSNIYIYR